MANTGAALDVEFTPLSAPYWNALSEGKLMFQRCPHCRHAWLPARQECPSCLRAGTVWEAAGGGGRLISWVVFHIAYHKAFADRLPYNVAIVELAEGPRLITNIVNPTAGMAIERPVAFSLGHDHGVALAQFRLV